MHETVSIKTGLKRRVREKIKLKPVLHMTNNKNNILQIS
jgi:hypothetical protein